ncbi:MAG: hypothetical protein JSS34_01410 [Proteobacteria bacterium]|nr:hypothetical protein [Pseudomonadota bacterium]
MTSFIEFSRLVNIPLRFLEGKPLYFEATQDECLKLAKRFGLENLKKLSFSLFFLSSQRPLTYPLKATLEADVVYTCVKTLDPFEDHIQETVYFTAQNPSLFKHEDTLEDLILTGEEETIEPLDAEGFLDVGEIIAQYLSLALNLYPSISLPSEVKLSSLPSKPFSLQEPQTHEKPSTYFPFKNLIDLKNKKKGT